MESRSSGVQEELDWDRLDKAKFFYLGAGLFSGVTTVLYPLSVIKTRQMALPGVSGGLQGAKDTAAAILKTDGVLGFYRGFGTVVFGTIPARMVYLSTLEMSKSTASKVGQQLDLSEPSLAGFSNFVGGGFASLATQVVTVPIDVISSKQVVHGSETVTSGHNTAAVQSAVTAQSPNHRPMANSNPAGMNASHVSGAQSSSSPPSVSNSSGQRVGALQVVRAVLKQEGIKGLYRGFGASVATFVPSSALWWGAYGAYQKLLWSLYSEALVLLQPVASSTSSDGTALLVSTSAQRMHAHSQLEVVTVQTSSGVLAGCTASLFTNPLDLIKTRVQVASRQPGREDVTALSVFRQIIKEEGPLGLLRGAVPRMVNASLWGTCMVTAYEWLKRNCEKPQIAS